MEGRKYEHYCKRWQEKADAYVNGEWETCGDAIPTVAGLANEIGINERTVHKWAAKHEAFAVTYDRLMQTQQRVAVNKGLMKVFDSHITRLILMNHGYCEKKDVAHTSPDGSMSPNKIKIVAGDRGDS